MKIRKNVMIHCLLGLGMVLVTFNCTGVRHTMLVQGKDPHQSWNYSLWFQRSDMELVGTITDSLTYTTYFGLINSNKDYRVTKRVVYPGTLAPTGIFGNYNTRVLYKLYEQKPDADIIIPVKIITRKEKMFLGSRKTLTMVGKAYKLK